MLLVDGTQSSATVHRANGAPTMANEFNASTIVDAARANGWNVSIAETANAALWRSDKSCGMTVFDRPTHVLTFKRGAESATMPATPHAGRHKVLDAKSMPKAATVTAWRYVRGNKADGRMLGTNGQPCLIDALGKSLQSKPKTKRAARKPKTAAAS